MSPTRERAEAALSTTLEKTDFSSLGTLYRGKVRDVYKTGDRLVLITSDRVSAFDHVLGTIPWKGRILNEIALDGFQRTKDLVPNHVLSTPDPAVIVARAVTAYPIEFVVRGYITGSLWRDYQSGKAGAYGLPLPSGMQKDQALPGAPMLTPSTKAEIGQHDEPISKAEIVRRGLMTPAALEAAEAAVIALFRRGTEIAQARGLILVDTKYELGVDSEGTLRVIDEIHTPDSSRYWVADGYEERLARAEPQKMLDKENLREWLIEKKGFSGHGTPPALDDQIRVDLALFYADLYERLLSRSFRPDERPPLARVTENLRAAGLLP
ncbi:MAG: phosphoribosylaminoimidazolesuccinocarboxamide synthase [Myxococcota bacterium]